MKQEINEKTKKITHVRRLLTVDSSVWFVRIQCKHTHTHTHERERAKKNNRTTFQLPYGLDISKIRGSKASTIFAFYIDVLFLFFSLVRTSTLTSKCDVMLKV